MELVRINNLVKSTAVLGPGKRAAIWFQGCMRDCQGCMSPGTRSFNGGVEVNVEKIINEILLLNDIEGITISGGEPFLQIDALYSLVKAVKEKTNLSVIVYTGYTLTELQEIKNSKVDQLIKNMVDILIDGEYIDDLNDGVSLRGSSNQTVHFLTERYKDCVEMYTSKKRNAEILVSNKDALFVGIPERETLNTWFKIKHMLNDREE